MADDHCASRSCNPVAGACRTMFSLDCDRAIGCAPIDGTPRACTQNAEGTFECTSVGSGGVGSPCGVDTDCSSGLVCDPTGRCAIGEPVEPVDPTDEVDLLLLIDNSNSMPEEQRKFVREIPRLVTALATGDVDADGTPDVQAVRSLHVGVVTPDLGSGPHSGVPSCAAGLGGDGILRAQSRLPAPCQASYPSNVFAFEPASSTAASFASTFACVADVGTGGCGFEQPLEAALKAVTPAEAHEWTAAGYVPPRFLGASGARDAVPGQADGPNAGFLRPSSVLAVLLLADDGDCSVTDYGLFVTTDPRFSTAPLNVRCSRYGSPEMGILYPVSRYVDGFIGLRARPENLVFSVIAGIPPGAEPPLGTVTPNFEAILADPDMEERPNPMGTDLMPSCSSSDGNAYPPVRIVRVAQGLANAGAGVSLSSICTSDFGPAVTSTVRRIAARLPPL